MPCVWFGVVLLWFGVFLGGLGCFSGPHCMVVQIPIYLEIYFTDNLSFKYTPFQPYKVSCPIMSTN